MSGYQHKGATAYKGMSQYTKAADASPHQLISMLYEGALERLNSAKGAMERKDIQAKGNMISKTITIVEGLRAHLDQEKGGEIATNLNDLYEYMEAQLLQANLKNDPAILEEVRGILEDLRSGWAGISEQAAALRKAETEN